MSEELYSTREWFESLAWQRPWIGYMVGWWVGQFGLPAKVLDFGCGDGWWPKCFADMGSVTGGIELNQIATEYIPQVVNVMICDLREPTHFEGTYDLCICLEVAEHMNKRDGDMLCNSLVKHMGDTLLFSAAGPGQTGTGHITLEPQRYWMERIERQGRVKFSPYKTGIVKNAFENITNELFAFLPRNLMVFCRI
jgi:hypothetical protein